MGWSSRFYIQSFMEIGLLVLEKKISKGILPYMGMAAIFVMWPASCHQIFISFYLKAFIQNLVQIGKVVSEKSRTMGILQAHLWAFGSGELTRWYTKRWFPKECARRVGKIHNNENSLRDQWYWQICIHIRGLIKPEDQWSCKRSPDILA